MESKVVVVVAMKSKVVVVAMETKLLLLLLSASISLSRVDGFNGDKVDDKFENICERNNLKNKYMTFRMNPEVVCHLVKNNLFRDLFEGVNKTL